MCRIGIERALAFEVVTRRPSYVVRREDECRPRECPLCRRIEDIELVCLSIVDKGTFVVEEFATGIEEETGDRFRKERDGMHLSVLRTVGLLLLEAEKRSAYISGILHAEARSDLPFDGR